MIQGDIISPIFFILDMERIFRKHDPSPTGTTVGKHLDAMVGNYLHVGVLGHADDAAIVSHETDKLTQRLSRIDAGSRDDADMTINVSKTKNIHVEEQEQIVPPDGGRN